MRVLQEVKQIFVKGLKFFSVHQSNIRWLVMAVLVLCLLPIHFAQADWIGSIANFFSSTIHAVAAAIGYFALGLMEMILVPILQYNAFGTSDTIGQGWGLVRDVVNMFVVILLIVMAIATIVGYEKASWQKNFPGFLLAIILVNFSRTICGFFIDISQVIMFTFVNAIVEVGAGNFANAVGLSEFGTMNPAAPVADSLMKIGAALLEAALYTFVAAVLVMLAVAFISRIVLLWVLVILSPLAFFTSGIAGMFGFASGLSGEWWKKFTNALTLGPILTFFVWLALALGTSDIAASEGFKVSNSGANPILSAFETSHLLSTFLGIALLIVGMEQASSAASSVGDLAEKMFGDKKTGRKMARNIVGRFGGNAVARGGANVADKVGGGIITTASTIGDSMLGRKIPFVAGTSRGFINAGGSLQKLGQDYKEHERTEAVKAREKMTRSQKSALDSMYAHNLGPNIPGADKWSMAYLRSLPGRAWNLKAREDEDAALYEHMTNSGLRKKRKQEMSRADYEQLTKRAMEYFDHNKGLIDDKNKDAIAKAKSQNLHLLSDSEREKFVQSADFKPSDMSEEAASTWAVNEELKKLFVEKDSQGNDVNAFQKLRAGGYGGKLRDASYGAVLNGATLPPGKPRPAGLEHPVYDAKTAADEAKKGGQFSSMRDFIRGAGRRPAVPEMAAAIKAERIKMKNLEAQDFAATSAYSNNLTMAVLQTGYEDRIPDSARANFEAAASRLKASGALNPQQTDTVNNIQLKGSAVGSGPTSIFVNPTTGAVDYNAVTRSLKKTGDQYEKFEGHIAGDDDLQDAVLDSVNTGALKAMATQYSNEVNPAEQDKIRRNIEVLAQAMNGRLRAGRKVNKKVKDINIELRNVAATVGATVPDDHR